MKSTYKRTTKGRNTFAKAKKNHVNNQTHKQMTKNVVTNRHALKHTHKSPQADDETRKFNNRPQITKKDTNIYKQTTKPSEHR